MSKPKLVIYGIGSMAKTYAMYLADHYEIVAYTVTQSLIHHPSFDGLPLVSFESIEQHYSHSQYKLCVAVGYIDLNKIRADIAAQAKQKGYELVTYVADDLRRHPSIHIGENTVILDKSSIHVNCKIGNNVFISSNVQLGHDCIIEDNVWINAGVCIGGGTRVSANSFIGMNATLSHGITLGERNFVGAATLVTKSTENDQVIIAPSGEVLPMNSQTFLRFSKRMANG